MTTLKLIKAIPRIIFPIFAIMSFFLACTATPKYPGRPYHEGAYKMEAVHMDAVAESEVLYDLEDTDTEERRFHKS